MEERPDGTWQLKVFLPEGKHEFQYVINGGGQGCWYLNETCEQHSTGKYTNSVIEIHPIQQVEEITSRLDESEETIRGYFASPISQPSPVSERKANSSSEEEPFNKTSDEEDERRFNP